MKKYKSHRVCGGYFLLRKTSNFFSKKLDDIRKIRHIKVKSDKHQKNIQKKEKIP